MKIQCQCGTKYSLDVTPEMGAKPIQFVCQSCGLDSSAAVNQIILQQLGLTPTAAEPPAAQPALRVSVPPRAAAAPTATPSGAPAAPTPSSAPAGLRVKMAHDASAASAPPSPAPPPADAAQHCAKHLDQLTCEKCLACQKPICAKCLEVFGFFCSAYCHGQAERMKIVVPVYQNQNVLVRERARRKVGRIVAGVAVLVTALVAFWGWYAFVGSKPRAVLAIKFPADYETGFCKIISPTEVLVRHGSKLARYDTATQQEIWSTLLIQTNNVVAEATEWLAEMKRERIRTRIAYEKIHGRGQYEEPPTELYEGRPITDAEKIQQMAKRMQEGLVLNLQGYQSGSNVWVRFPKKLVRYDWATGKAGREVALPERVERIVQEDASLLLVERKESGQQTLLRIDLATGETQTEELAQAPAPTPAPATVAKAAAKPLKKLATRTSDGDEDGEMDSGDSYDFGPQLIIAGQEVAQVSVKLIEQKIVEQKQPIRKTAAKVSEFDKGISGANAGAAVREMIGEWKQGANDGVRVNDESRYRVTIKRLRGGSGDWTGEVVGRPSFFPLKLVDVLIGGKAVLVFDKSGKQLWEGKINYPIGEGLLFNRSLRDEDAWSRFVPCVEQGDALYVFDMGVLTCFEIATGAVRWRLTSVGISQVQFDQPGMVYVTTTSAGSEKILSPEEIDIPHKDSAVILKVDPKTGKTLWKIEKTGWSCLFSGKFLYAIESHPGEEIFKIAGIGMPAHVRIYRLNPSNGNVEWEYYQKRYPLDMDFSQNTIQMLFRTEMQVLKFHSF